MLYNISFHITVIVKIHFMKLIAMTPGVIFLLTFNEYLSYNFKEELISVG